MSQFEFIEKILTQLEALQNSINSLRKIITEEIQENGANK